MKSILQTLVSIVACLTMASCSSDQSSQSTQTQLPTEQQQGTYSETSADSFYALWKNKEGKLLDVRTPEEFAGGHLPGATMIDYMADDFSEQIRQLDRDTTYLLYCHSGSRSRMAGKEMEQLGFDVVNMNGGIVAWMNKKYELAGE